jgi:hypothetical protein
VASVESVDGVKHYTGLTGNTFKKRYYKHEGDFRNTSGKNNTRLSKYIWKLKEEGKNYEIKWEIMDRAPTHNPINKNADCF